MVGASPITAIQLNNCYGHKNKEYETTIMFRIAQNGREITKKKVPKNQKNPPSKFKKIAVPGGFGGAGAPQRARGTFP